MQQILTYIRQLWSLNIEGTPNVTRANPLRRHVTPNPVAESFAVEFKLISVPTWDQPRTIACEANALPLRHRGGRLYTWQQFMVACKRTSRDGRRELT